MAYLSPQIFDCLKNKKAEKTDNSEDLEPLITPLWYYKPHSLLWSEEAITSNILSEDLNILEDRD